VAGGIPCVSAARRRNALCPEAKAVKRPLTMAADSRRDERSGGRAETDRGQAFMRARLPLLVMLAVLAGCAPFPGGAIAVGPAPSQAYVLDSGDRLRITVFGQPELSGRYAVDSAGAIAMPLLGSVPARGLTTDALGARIANALAAGFVRNPSVAVEIEQHRPFYILGEVRNPGQYPFAAGLTAEMAVAIAG